MSLDLYAHEQLLANEVDDGRHHLYADECLSVDDDNDMETRPSSPEDMFVVDTLDLWAYDPWTVHELPPWTAHVCDDDDAALHDEREEEEEEEQADPVLLQGGEEEEEDDDAAVEKQEKEDEEVEEEEPPDDGDAYRPYKPVKHMGRGKRIQYGRVIPIIYTVKKRPIRQRQRLEPGMLKPPRIRTKKPMIMAQRVPPPPRAKARMTKEHVDQATALVGRVRLPGSTTPIMDALVYCALQGWGVRLMGTIATTSERVKLRFDDFALYSACSMLISAKTMPPPTTEVRIKALQRWFPLFPTIGSKAMIKNRAFDVIVAECKPMDDKPSKLCAIIVRMMDLQRKWEGDA